MKKIPYALILLVAYIVMTFLGARVAMDGGTVMQLSNLLIFVGPMVLAVLMIIGLKKPMVGIASIVCMLLGIAWVCVSCVRISELVDMISAAEAEYGDGLHLLVHLPSIIAGVFNALLYLAVAGKLQEDEVTGGYSALAALGLLATLVSPFLLMQYTFPGVTLSVIPSLIHITFLKNLPAAFLRPETCKKLAVKHIVTLAILMAAFIMHDQLISLIMGI